MDGVIEANVNMSVLPVNLNSFKYKDCQTRFQQLTIYTVYKTCLNNSVQEDSKYIGRSISAVIIEKCCSYTNIRHKRSEAWEKIKKNTS